MATHTRFAPSPTGYLHIGGARTALFSWLHSQQNQGDFILRIEDTDLERSKPEYVQAILDGMDWLGLDHQQGPFYQTQRFDRYKEIIQQLLDNDQAYYCYCTREELEAKRNEQMANKQKPRYDRRCRNHGEPRDGVSPVVRFKTPLDGSVVIDDLVRGKIVIQNSELDDLIIARSDGTPTYNLTVVVDDSDMQVSHVIRGDDHINNTPRQIHILNAIGAAIPQYAHVPMILGEDGKRLSKRHGAVSVLQYRDDGYLPEALLNYLVRLGWSDGDQEIFSRQDLLEKFSLDGVNKAPSTFNADKLLWLNQHYLKTLDTETLLPHLQWHMAQLDIPVNDHPPLSAVLDIQRERAKTLLEMAQNSRFFYQEFDQIEAKARKKNLKAAIKPSLQRLLEQLQQVSAWTAENIHQCLNDVAEEQGIKFGKLAQPFRVSITGGAISPPIDITAELIGKERVIQRLSQTIETVPDTPAQTGS
jgi:glutamyl-tRNA synthetase